jgi:hypothetical protein
MQTKQKQESFRLSNANPFSKRFVLIECIFLVPGIVLASYEIDIFTSSIPISYEDDTTNRIVMKIFFDLHIHLTISNVYHIRSHEISRNHKFYQNNVVQNEY